MLDDASAIFPGEYIMCESIEGWRNLRPLVILPGSGGKPYGNPHSQHVFITCFHKNFIHTLLENGLIISIEREAFQQPQADDLSFNFISQGVQLTLGDGLEKSGENHGKTMEKPWKNHGKTMEKPWKNVFIWNEYH